MMRKLTLLMVALIGLCHQSNAQYCGFDQVHRQLLNTSTTYSQNVQDANTLIAQVIQNNSSSLIINTANGPVYDIPVVIHVIHTGGIIGSAYNPSDVTLQGMITYLNQTYAATYASYPNASSGGTYFPVQFTLAKRDPNCNATTGIERFNGSALLGPTYTLYGVKHSGTNGITDANVKAVSVWNNNDYYNIWVVNKIDSNDGTFGTYTAGYAYFPGAGPALDGTVMLAGKSLAGEITLPHEIGHAFNLYHVFEGDDPGNTGAATTCPSTTNCTTTGDLVCDTEPMKRSTFNCPTGINACTGVAYANTQHNFMDYSNCQDRFTSGQETRWLAALLNIRGSLVSSLGATTLGVAPTAYNCVPTINYPFNLVDAGPYEVRFNDMIGTSSGGYNQDGNLVFVDRACHQRANVVAGQSYTISVKTMVNPQHVRVYIDYNNDGVFNTTNEFVYDHTGTLNTETHSGSITIPASPAVTCSPIRMRVVSDLSSSSAPTPCGALDYGQAEDYSLVIRPVAPSTITVALASGSSNPSCSGATVGFNATYTGTPTGPSVKWYVNGVFSGTTGTSYSASTFANGDVVTAKLFFTGTCGPDSVSSAGFNVIRSSTVAPTVSIAVTSGSNPGCAGAPITFTATPTNGGTAPTYKWYVGATLQVGVTGNTFSTSTLPCNSSVSAILTSNATCASTTTATSNTITYTCGTQAVSVSIAVTSGTNPSCQSRSVKFTATPVNGGTAPVYQWYLNGVAITGAVGSTYTTTTLVNGDSVFAMLTSNYPCATTPTVKSPAIYMTVIANVTPVVTKAITAGANPGCEDSLIQFTASTSNAGAAPTFRWYINNVFTGVTSQVYSNFTANNGDLVYVRIVPSGIGSACYSKDTAYSDTTLLVRLPTPALPVISFIGHDLVSDSSNVLWYGPAGLLPGGISQTYRPTVQGSYYAVIPTALCGGGKSNVLIVSPLMVSHYNMNGVQLYPNPTTGVLTITWANPATTRITVYTPSGQAVMHDIANVATKKVLNLSQLASGVYFVMLQDERGETGTVRVTVTH